jgi:hypothetical protein
VLGVLRAYARDWAQEGVLTTVFVAHDWSTVEKLTGAGLRTISPWVGLLPAAVAWALPCHAGNTTIANVLCNRKLSGLQSTSGALCCVRRVLNSCCTWCWRCAHSSKKWAWLCLTAGCRVGCRRSPGAVSGGASVPCARHHAAGGGAVPDSSWGGRQGCTAGQGAAVSCCGAVLVELSFVCGGCLPCSFLSQSSNAARCSVLTWLEAACCSYSAWPPCFALACHSQVGGCGTAGDGCMSSLHSVAQSLCC